MVLFLNTHDEKTLYVAGDTVWYNAVQEVIDTHKPEIIVVNAGDNQFLVGGSLVMGKDDVYEVVKGCTRRKNHCCPHGSCKSLDIIQRRIKELYQ